MNDRIREEMIRMQIEYIDSIAKANNVSMTEAFNACVEEENRRMWDAINKKGE